MNKRRYFWLAAGAILLLAFLAPAVVSNEHYFYVAYVVLQYVVLATAWNILGGYAGYVNFGTGAFFGAGAYASLFLLKFSDAPLLLQILAGAVVSGLLGLGAGLLTFRLRGIFFSIATIAAAIIVETLVVNWRYVGGAAGSQVLRSPVHAPFTSHTQMMFFAMAALCVLSIAIARYIEHSSLGRGLRALRDTEVAAESVGIPTVKLKLIVFAISGAMMGAAGAPFPMYVGFIEPVSAFSLNYSIMALAMAVIGGMSHWTGPVIGALLLASAQQISATTMPQAHLAIVGALLILFVMAAPEGLLGLVRVAKMRRSR
jgi:branched-chain amino acid transport system permease protein